MLQEMLKKIKDYSPNQLLKKEMMDPQPQQQPIPHNPIKQLLLMVLHHLVPMLLLKMLINNKVLLPPLH